MKDKHVQVADRSDLARVGDSAVIVNTNQKAFHQYIRQRKALEAKDARIEDLEDRLERLERLVDNINNSN